MTDTDRHDEPLSGSRSAPDPPEYETGGLRLVLLIAVVALLGLRFGWPVLVMILGVVVMIFLHELGHFVTAKWSGMKVTEFFIGFGPKIWSFQRGETEYGLKVIPAGAYVRIVGMNNLDEVDPADEPRTYRQQSFPKRLLVVSAGSLMHFLQAFVLLVVLLGVVGIPGGRINPKGGPPAWEVRTVAPDSAAADVGLTKDDRILAIDGRPASAFQDFRDAIRGHQAGDVIPIEVDRASGGTETLDVRLGARPADEAGGPAGGPFLGVGTLAAYPDQPLGIGTAVARAPGEMVGFMGDSVGALAGFFSPHGLSGFADNVSHANDKGTTGSSGSGSAASGEDNSGNRLLSIIGVVRLGAQATEQGWMLLLFLFFQINIFIGIFNMVPLPPLDGGHAAVAIYERIRSRRGRPYRADVAKLLPLTYAVVMGLVVIGITAMYLDIVNPIDL